MAYRIHHFSGIGISYPYPARHSDHHDPDADHPREMIDLVPIGIGNGPLNALHRN